MLSSNRTTVPTMQAADAAVLRLFYEVTGGATWFNRSGWDSDPVSCVAAGVTCGYGGAVVGLSFSLNPNPYATAWPTYVGLLGAERPPFHLPLLFAGR